MEYFYHEGSQSLFVEIQAVSVGQRNGNRTEERSLRYTGVILFCRPQFAFIIAHNACLSESTNPNWIEVTFPDGTKIVIASDKIRPFERHFIVLSCIPEKKKFNTEVVKAVEFSEEKLGREELVHTLCLVDFDQPADLTSGVVGRSEDSVFYHGCRAGSYAKYGSPVFNDKAQFVGLCYGAPCGILAASTVWSIAKNLSFRYGIVQMGIKEILEQIFARNMDKADTTNDKISGSVVGDDHDDAM